MLVKNPKGVFYDILTDKLQDGVGGNHTGYYVFPGSYWGKLKTTIQGKKKSKSQEIWVENELTDSIRNGGGIFVNDTFIDLWNETNGILLLKGGYGSSKTTYIITRLLLKALFNKNYKCLYGRQKKIEAREIHKNLIREIKRNGWENLFEYSEQPNGHPDIRCVKNGNVFHLFGCEEIDSLKGFDNPSDIFVDEINQIEFTSFGMLVSRLRTPGVEHQLIGCFNDCDVDKDHWLYKIVYKMDSDVPLTTEESELAEVFEELNTVKHHSCCLDNYFLNVESYKRTLILKAGGDRNLVEIYIKGGWGVQLNAQPYYKLFKELRDVYDPNVVLRMQYNPKLPLEISVDENSNPYLPCLVSQVDGNELRVICEIAGRNPNNRIKWIAEEIIRLFGYNSIFNPHCHNAEMFIHGDATSRENDTKLEQGQNLFTQLASYLKMFHPTIMVPKSNPNQKDRGRFINTCFSDNYGGIRIMISSECSLMIEDFKKCMEEPSADPKKTGRKSKKVEMVDGIRGVQKYGHFGDCFDYTITDVFASTYYKFCSGDVSFDSIGGKRLVKNGYQVDKEEDFGSTLREVEEVVEVKFKKKSSNRY